MTKIHIFSGFLGAGKTTLIKKLIAESYAGEKLVLIENEFGEIGIDGGFLQDAGVAVTEMNSGCICCSLVGDFGKALAQVLETYHPDRILIEPSGVGKLSDVIRAVQNVQVNDAVLEGSVTVVDAKKCKMYQKNFGEFWGNQIENADCIILSHTKGLSPEKLKDAADRVRSMNDKAVLITTDWEELTGNQILAAINRADTLNSELEKLKEETCEHHHHHHHEEGEECCCGHHHDHDEECDHEHEHHHHHEDGEECCCGHHHHHHDHEHEHEHHHHEDGEECCCGHHHDHEHEHEHEHHHHHADDIFTSWGRETTRVYSEEEIASALSELENEEKFGFILRAKGIVPCTDGTWIHFDYVPGTPDIRRGSAGTTGRLCVIGSKINEENIAEIFMA
ncbi:MAG: CobW family GTP-binding protein [Ruminococcus sp.]